MPTVRRSMAVTLAVTSVATAGIASNVEAVEPVPARPVLPAAAEIGTDQFGNWSIVGAAPENVLTQAAPDADPLQTATAVVADYAVGLGIADPAADLVAQPVRELDDGGKVVRFDQRYNGIPVFASGVAVRLTPDNATLSVSSTVVANDRTMDIDLAPTIDQAQAVDMARTAVIEAVAASTDAEPEHGSQISWELDPNQLVASTPEMNIYDATIVGGDPNAEVLNGPRLVWSLVLSGPDETTGYRVLVDAVDPAVLLVYSEVAGSRRRRVCDYGNSYSAQVCRAEGAPGDATRTEMNRAYIMAGQVHYYFLSNYGRDSWDNKGATIFIDTRVCKPGAFCPLDGSHWTGSKMWLGEGYGNADDVIAHEFTHGMISREANLVYYAESGAIHESFADVFGEMVDQTNDLLGTDKYKPNWGFGEDTLPGRTYEGFRSFKNPPIRGAPDRVLHPNYDLGPWWNDNMGVHTNSGVNNKAAYLIAAGGSFGGANITGIGIKKTSAIYYEALTAILTPGSDWIDLYYALPRACKNLIGKSYGGSTLVQRDCNMVFLAVSVTEMNKAALRRLTVTPSCKSGYRTEFFKDDAESGFAKWATNTGGWGWYPTYRASQSGRTSFFGQNPAGTSRAGSYDTWLRTKNRVKIPWTGESFLWFDHSFDLERGYDGGVVEYSLDGGVWHDLGPSIVNHGYTDPISPISNSPLAGRSAFSAKSRGFQQTKVSLARARGNLVYIRFRIGADGAGRGAGWHVDDVTMYNCSSIKPGFSSGYQPITPRRLIDTRNASGLVKARGIRPSGSVLKFNARSLGIYGRGHTPTALNLTITMVENSGPGHVTVYPCGTRPTTSVLNATQRNTVVVNTATVPLSASGELCIYNRTRAHLIVDVAGYQTSTKGSTPPSRYQPVSPRRVIDTRNSSGLFKVQGRRAARSVLQFDISNLGIFAPNTTPRALDLTVSTVGNAGPGHVTAYPCGTRPITTVLNTYKPNQVVSNTATVPVSAGDKICIYTHMATDLVVDVNGYYSDTRGPAHSLYKTLTPRRLVDTRNTSGLYKTRGKIRAGSVLRFNVNKLGIHNPRVTPTAYDLTFTMIGNTAPGYITAHPCQARPTAATMTAAAPRMVIANTVTAPVSASGEICIYTSTTTDLTIDVSGYHYTV